MRQQMEAEEEEERAAKAKEAEAARKLEARKSPRKKRAEAKANIHQAGVRMASRVRGLIEREAGRLIDQFEILNDESSRSEVELKMWESFKPELDKTAKGIMKR